MLGLPPEIADHHVRGGAMTITALGMLLVATVAWQLGHVATIAPAMLAAMLLAVITSTVLFVRRHYRHAVAGALLLIALLSLLGAAVHRFGNPVTLACVVVPTPPAVANAATPR
jgi:hypothetical protein